MAMRITRDRTSTAAPPRSTVPTPAPSEPESSPPPAQRSALQRRRDALAAEVTELHWDLGGLAYEMAVRDHFRLDVLVRRAAVLQARDAELAEVERLLRMEAEGVAGNCPSCGAPHSRGAVYCWQCGATLMQPRHSDTLGAGEPSTAVMDALLASPETAPDPE